jgi:hypothetical protein
MPGIFDRLRRLAGSSQLSISFPHIVLAVQKSARNNDVYVLLAKLGSPSEPTEVTEFVTYKVVNQNECSDGSYLLVRDGAAIFGALEVFRTRLDPQSQEGH